MPPLRPVSILVLCLVSATAGCHLTGLYGPVPAAVDRSRQLSQKGITLLEQGQQREAEDLLAKAVAACPTDQDARHYYAETLWLRNATSAAVAQQEEACRLSPGDAALRVRLAEMYLAMGRMEQARQSAEAAIQQNSKSPGAWAVRGRLMPAQGNLPQALADYHRVLTYTPDDRQILMEVAEIHRQQQKPQRVLETLQTLAETYSPGEEPPQVLDMLGMAYLAVQRDDDALERFTAAARGRPMPEILCRLAQGQASLGRFDAAAASLQRALVLDPQFLPARQMSAQMEMAQRAAVRR